MRKIFFFALPWFILTSCAAPEKFTEDITLTIDQSVNAFSGDDCGIHSETISSSTYTNSSWTICLFSGRSSIESITVKQVSLVFKPDEDNEIEDVWAEYTFGGATASFNVPTGIPVSNKIPKNEWQVGLVDASINDVSISNEFEIKYRKSLDDTHLDLIGESELNILYEITYWCDGK